MQRQVAEGGRVIRIRLDGRLQIFLFFLDVSVREIVMLGDVKPLALAHPLPQVERLAGGLKRSILFPNVAVNSRQPCIGQGKIRIQLDGALEQRNGFGLAAAIAHLVGRGIRLQCF